VGLRTKPTYRQRRFGAEVRRLREQAGLSSTDAAALLGLKQPHLSNVEAGKTSLTPDRVRLLTAACGASSTPFIEALNELRQQPGKGWWSDYRKILGEPHLDLAELEAGAVALSSYEPTFIPGLLQTENYVRAMYRGGYAEASPEEREAAIAFRMQRQSILLGEPPTRLQAVIHEAALHASLGDRDIMRGQLLRLIEASRLPHVTIQILPFEGAVAFGTGFMVIEPSEPKLSTALVSHIERDLYLEDEDSITKYQGWFASLQEAALPPVDAAVSPESHAVKDSLGLIQRLLYPLL
jgi:transcriptional regulator with XRE-family HTH domain